MSKLDNIERFKKMKELSKLKAELHKRNALAYLPWNKLNADEEMWGKILHYGELGYSIYQLIKTTSQSQAETKEAT